MTDDSSDASDSDPYGLGYPDLSSDPEFPGDLDAGDHLFASAAGTIRPSAAGLTRNRLR